jgi:small subunit ribosomal protein S16
MLAIKLRPTGKKHQRHFRMVVLEKRSKLQGKYVDNLGWLDPHENKYTIDKEKAEEWIKKGAQPTDTAHNLLVRAGVLKTNKIPVHKKKKATEPAKTAEGAPSKTSVAEGTPQNSTKQEKTNEPPKKEEKKEDIDKKE